MSQKSAVILFGKYPREGFVKTRLAHSVGDAKATEFYRHCLQSIFTEAQKLPDTFDVFFYFAELEDQESIKNMTPPSFTCVPQISAILTDRIRQSFMEVFHRGYQRVHIYSTDVPELNADIMQTADNQLRDNHCVIGPDSDGGYYCLGMNKYLPELFDVQYGADKGMYAQTQENAQNNDLSYTILPEMSDIDTLGDLQSFRLRNPRLWSLHYCNLDDYTATT